MVNPLSYYRLKVFWTWQYIFCFYQFVVYFHMFSCCWLTSFYLSLKDSVYFIFVKYWSSGDQLPHFCLCGNVFTSPSYLKQNLPLTILGCQLLSSTLWVHYYTLLACRVSTEGVPHRLIVVPLWVMHSFPLNFFRILSLFLIFNSFVIKVLGEHLFTLR